MKYKTQFSLEQRIQKSAFIKNKYPHLVPLIIENFNDAQPKLEKNKYLISKNSKFNIISNIIRSSITLDKAKALFFYTNNKLINQNDLILSLYERYKDEDGFLYIEYSLENTFG